MNYTRPVRLARFARLIPLCALVLLGAFACKGAPRVAISGDEIPEYGDEDFGGYDGEGWDWEEGEDDDDEPSLALPPDVSPDVWSGDLIEPSLEGGEAFLPDSPPEEAALTLAEPLPEPEPPDLPEPPPPVLAGEPSPEALSTEALPPEELLAEGPAAEEPVSEEPSAEEPPPEPAPPPPPPRMVRPSEPIPPPPPARAPIPMPPVPLPDLPARNPPVLTPSPEPSPGLSSRVVRALAGQTVEVPFRGTGWVYLGESASKRGVDYVSRRLDGEGQTFVFRAAEAGLYELQFYRQDFIRDYSINDLITVIVEEPPVEWSVPPRPGVVAERGTVIAEPRWPVLAGRTTPEAAPAPPGTQAGSGPTVPPGTRAGSGTAVSPGPRAGSGPAASPGTRAGSGPAAPPETRAGSGAAVPVPAPSAGAAVPETPGPGIPGPGIPGPGIPGSSPGSSAVAAAPEDPQAGAVEPFLLPPQDTAAEEFVRRAREEYQEGRFPQSMALLDQFLERFPLGSDEAYWLYAQLCEKQGPSRNIRRALDYYRRLIAEYPQSGHYRDARRRIAYLERYYINIQ